MDKPLVVVMTPDRNTDAAVRRAFDADGSTHSMSVATIVINGTSSSALSTAVDHQRCKSLSK